MLLDSSSYHATSSRRGMEDWRFRFARGKRLSIPLTKHTLDVISQPGVTVRSFTLTRNRLSLCIALDVAKLECTSTVGVDRNLRNLTVGNEEETRHYDLSRTVRIASTTTRIVASFKRDDSRIRTGIASKYGMRRTARTGHLLHATTKTIVAVAVQAETGNGIGRYQGHTCSPP